MWSLSLLLLFGATTTQAAQPAILVFGGGWGPDGTQASIEAHVQALIEVLQPGSPEVLFAGPEPIARSVQVLSNDKDEIGAMLGLVFGESEGVGVDYRAARVKSSGPATEQRLLEALMKGAERPEGLVVFGVGHGQLVGPENRQESALALWGSHEALSLSRLVERLDERGWKGPLALVLGQCHSGGFVDLAFRRAKPSSILAVPTRCVLAAVPGDRPASGCTSDLSDASARAFIALIAEAFSRVSEADLDKDRAISLAEAFTYARVHDQTVNVPVRSSEAYLRQVGTPPKTFPARRLLLGQATPEEKAVLEALAPKLEATEVMKRFEDLAEQRNRQGVRLDELARVSDEKRTIVQELLFARWPELTSRLHKESRRLLSEDAKELVAFLEGRPELQALAEASNLERSAESELESLERQSARLERWLRAAENVLYERQLKARPGHRRNLAALRACEGVRPLRGARP